MAVGMGLGVDVIVLEVGLGTDSGVASVPGEASEGDNEEVRK
jgi:hypothetical protein